MIPFVVFARNRYVRRRKMNEQRIIKVEREGLLDQFYALYIGRKWFDEGQWYGEMAVVEFGKYKEGEYSPPAVAMSKQECQVLIDSLWDAGIRPTEGCGSAGSLKATQYHLEDMRKIALKP